VRRSIVAGNWKMNKTIPDGVELAGALSDGAGEFIDGCDVVLCPPFTAVKAVARPHSGIWNRCWSSGCSLGIERRLHG